MTDFDRNRLADAASPYLRQHAGNPVHWQPWDAAALDHARATDTPILLSIGYSACHWCHVMAHECFENAAIAAAMNAQFVCIKLDREERPDLDHVYQLAHQALHGRGGGWPLTAFLDPQDLSPYFVGTYFPPEPRHGLPGLPTLLARAREYFDAHRGELREQADALRAWFAQAEPPAETDLPDFAATHARALQGLAAHADAQWGGREGAPKFPRPAELEWLLDARAEPAAAQMATRTLVTMAARGLQDHLGGGFFRYCVDAHWSIPHFEKMLYDNAQLLPVYARLAADPAAEAGARATAREAVQGILDWLAREMSAPDGSFFSSLDADSEHAEGRYYLWTREAFHAALDPALLPLAEQAYGLDQPPNFEEHAWHLMRHASPAAPAAAPELAAIRQQLFAQRERRVRPARDDKRLTAWNALTIAGLARTARLGGDAHATAMAQRALAALRAGAWIDGRLQANITAPEARIPAFLDDHAFLIDALLETLQLRFDARELGWAIALADALLERYTDARSGAFLLAAAEHATPLARGLQLSDDALPSGNAVAIRALLRLGHLVGETRYLDAAERALKAGAGALVQYPEACPSLLRAWAEYASPRAQIVIRCDAKHEPHWRALLDRCRMAAALAPGADAVDAFFIPPDATDLPALLAARPMHCASGTAWVCAGHTCQPPAETPAAFEAAFRAACAAAAHPTFPPRA